MADNEIVATNTDTDESAINVQTASAWSTITGGDVRSRMTLASMLNSAESLNGHEGETFTLREVFFKPGVRKGRNGNPDTECTDTYLLTGDGVVYFTKSEGIARSVRNILMLIPDLNGEDGVPVKVDALKTQNGNTFKQLVPVI